MQPDLDNILKLITEDMLEKGDLEHLDVLSNNMTPEEKKLEKLQQILSLADQDYVTVEDFNTAVDLLVEHIKGAVGVNDSYKEEFVKYCEQEVKDARNDIEGAKTDCKKVLDEIVKKANSLKNGKDGRDGYTPIKGVDYFDGKDGEKGEKGDAGDIKELSPDEIRDALEILEGDERLDKSAIKGIDEIEKMARLNAMPVTTSFVNGNRAKNIHINGATVSVQGDTAYVTTPGGGGAVDSVNGATGVVVLDADDIDDTSTTNKFVTATDVTNLSNLSGTNTGDQDLSGYLTSATAASTYEPIKGADDNFVTDAEKTKLSNISITQAVDLDALETASHAAVTLAGEDYLSLSTQQITANPIDLDNLSATGTPSSSTFLRGDNTWATPAGSGDVSKVGTPVNDQIAIWTGDGTIEGSNNLQFDGSTMAVTGNVTVDDEAYGPSWDASIQVPTKNALYDKIESISGGATAFTGLTDVPSSYNTGDAGKYVKVNATEDGLEFVAGGSGSGITRTITTSSGGFTAGATADTDYVYLIAGAHAVALPTAVGNTNRYTFKNNHSAAITITPDGAETIEGSATIQVAPEDSVDLISNNSVWFVI